MTAGSNVTRAFALAALMLFAGGMAWAAEPAKPDNPPAAAQPAGKPETKRPLAGLPSKPGPHIAKIQALGDNAWLNLDSPAADPAWGRARGNAWGGRSMVLAPDLRGAFEAGEGFHAGVKPDGFGQDDYWFYDINGHRWICIYPGTDTRNFNRLVKDGALKVDGSGRVVDATGQVVPAHLMIHAFGMLTYDTDRKQLIINGQSPFNRYYMPGLPKAIEEGLAVLEAQGLNKKRGWQSFAPWTYDPQTGRFDRPLAANERIEPGTWASTQCFYSPGKKQLIHIGCAGVVCIDPVTGASSRVNVKGSLLREDYVYSAACHDPRRDRIYFGPKPDKFFSYDVQTGSVTDVSGQPVPSVDFNNNISSLDYDSVNDVVLCFDFTQKKIVPFHPETKTWSAPIAFGATFKRHETNRVCFDPALGVYFVWMAGDSQDDGVMWVYRYKKAAKP